jgi:hypothetical protein
MYRDIDPGYVLRYILFPDPVFILFLIRAFVLSTALDFCYNENACYFVS